MNSAGKYKPFVGVEIRDRQWPSKRATQAPIWCSVDLRDGNQALAVPMTVEQKVDFFKMLVQCGFKEIEVGFPAASPTEFTFVRRLIEDNLIPDDVTIQVLVQAREDLIRRTCESLVGARKAIIHLYNSTSPAQREIVFGKTKDEIKAIAVQGTEWVLKYSEIFAGTEIRFQYSPESFSATETDFALEVCEAVMNAWGLESGKIIFNLPETVEMATPNVYADQVEWFCKHMRRRACAIISVHAHNDRGTGIAATELALLAGADRVEGTLFGNGERTGNTDIVAVALNMYTQGIDPNLDFSNIDAIRQVYERCTGMTVPPRQPYSGELVFTAFSGSHQDAIRKGLRSRAFKFNTATSCAVLWDVPYLIMDPADVGREYNELIRVNGQSGKGGIAHLLETGHGIRMPKDMEREFGAIAGKQIDVLSREVTAEDLKAMFWKEYIERETPYQLISFQTTNDPRGCHCHPAVRFNDEIKYPYGVGNGPIDAFVRSMQGEGIQIHVLDQSEHALGTGEDAQAIAYIKLRSSDGRVCWGAGIDTSIELASIKAIVSALNRNANKDC